MSSSDDTRSPEAERARDRLDGEAEAVRTEQLEQALSRLAGEGELTETQRVAVERLSERLVDGVLAGPRSALDRPSNRRRAARTVLALFDR